MRNLLLFFVLSPILSFAQVKYLGPYLQDATTNSIVVMWETTAATDAKLAYGLTEALGSEATGTSTTGFTLLNLTRIHTVKIEGLSPDTKYYYSVNFGGKYSDTIAFMTAPLPSSEKSFGMIAFSDMQRDATKPGKFREVVEDGVLDYAEGLSGNSIPEKLAYVLVPGDLVDVSYIPVVSETSYRDQFFNPGSKLFEMVPVYPVLGNHEYIGSPDPFFKYFDLPKNGTDGYLEQWWYKDYSNTRIIGLESNVGQISGTARQQQLDWLEDVLDDACSNPDIDFVFAQLHHPFHSEMWVVGNEPFTGDVIKALEDFSSSCHKPSIHFYGHTHSYGRGQSKDHQHLMVNVASAGGALDNWDGGDVDYEEFSKGISDYGFVYLEVEAGDDPKFTLKRVSRGRPSNPVDNEIRDSIVVYKNGQSPNKPVPIQPIEEELNPQCVVLEAGLFASASPNTLHGESQWQVAADCGSFDNPIVDVWKNYENIYFNNDTQAGDDLTDQDIAGLAPNSSYCWRVRYRDRNLRWSEWSDPRSFTTRGTGTIVSEIDTTICAGESVEFFGESLTAEGTYTIADPNSGECAEEYVITVSVIDTQYVVLNEAICPEDSIVVGDLIFTEEGSYEVVLSNSAGCDSIVQLNLTILTASDAGCTTGINDHLIEGLVELYPNPFSTEAIIKLKYLPEQNLQLKVFNEAGELVSQRSNINANEISIRRENLASGVYFYMLGKEDKIYARGNFVIKD
ncbi:MAG: fibronectin type III domain-containing protein [Chitinophagales bacterium]